MGKSISATGALSQYCEQNNLSQPEYDERIGNSNYIATCYVTGLPHSQYTGYS